MERMRNLLHCICRLLYYCCWRLVACWIAAAQPHRSLHEAQDVLVVSPVGLVARKSTLDVQKQKGPAQAVSSVY
jgi:hypothetical protein